MASQQVDANVVRKLYLISRHGSLLQITEDTIEGSENGRNDAYTTLEMISVAPGEIVFRGQSANRYIGMDSDGNLFTHSSLSENCVFKEHHNTNGYSSFESRSHGGWYLALTNDRRAKPGPKTAPGQRAVEFLPGNI